MKQFEVVTFGSALKDIMFYCPEMRTLKQASAKFLAVPYGAKLPIEDVHVNYGGGAMNVAVGLHNFGIHVSPLIRLGRDDVGREIFSYLKARGLNTSLITVDPTERTGFSIVAVAPEEREHVVFAYKGASSQVEATHLKKFQTKWVYISGLVNIHWEREVDKIVRLTERGTEIFWNPGELQLREPRKMARLLKYIEVLILNEDEARELVRNLRRKSAKDVKQLLVELSKCGPRKVIITRGAKGVSAIDDTGKIINHSALKLNKEIKDTVGAGDAFSSGFLAAYLRWHDFDRAIQLGIRNSANVLTQIGAQNGLLKIRL